MQTRASQTLPRARTTELIVRELPEEVLVYDTESEKAHCLNHAAAFVWKHCDGKRTVKELVLLFEREFGAPVDEDVVWLALKQLRRLHLLEEESETLGMMKVSRRDLVQKYLPAALALPVILSVAAPAAAQAASGCVALGGVCTTTTDCCPGASVACVFGRCQVT